MKAANIIRRIVTNPFVLVPVIGTVLFLPSLDGGFYRDDLYHLAILENNEQMGDLGPLSLYNLADGRSDRMGPVQGDMIPWWVSEDFRQNFWRPASCVLHVIDHAIYGMNPVGYHVTNLIIWVFLLVTVVLLYRELAKDFQQSAWTVLLAGLFFALDDAHSLNVTWIAHRYALIGALFSTMSLLHYHRYRRDGSARSILWAMLFFCLGLMSYEGSVGLILWVVAYELCIRRDKWVDSIRAVSPVALVLIVYVAFYGIMGFGNYGSQHILNPLETPWEYVKESFLERLPFLLSGVLTPVQAEMGFGYFLYDKYWLLWLAWGLGVGALLLFIPVIRKNRVVMFMVVGGLLTLFTGTTVYPHNRMLLLPSVGIAWMLGACVKEAFSTTAADEISTRSRILPLVSRWYLRCVALAVIFIHGVIAPVRLVYEDIGFDRQNQEIRRVALEAEMPEKERSEQARILMLPSFGVSVVAMYRWYFLNSPYPKAVWAITPPEGDYSIKRTGLNSFELRIMSRRFLRSVYGYPLRTESKIKTGDRFEKGALEVVVREVDDSGDIRRVVFKIDRSLDDEDVWLMVWNGKKFYRRLLEPIETKFRTVVP
jgi:hypothetical protein